MTTALAELLRARARALRDEADLLEGLAEQADAPATPEAYSQHHRPLWLPTANLYLRAWRTLHAERHPGVSAHGKTRCMSRDAAIAWRDRTASEPRKRATIAAAPESSPRVRDVGSEIDRALGIRLRGAR